jgi:peptide methionine sulfoxide reductase MsrA
MKKEIAIFAAGCFWGDRRLSAYETNYVFLIAPGKWNTFARAALFLVRGRV